MSDWDCLAQILPIDWLAQLPMRFMELFVIAWVAFAAACVGSFLNVVVYRLPRGQGVMWERSRCPRCGHGISARDNIPVLGWLRLEGRCRSCREPISARYPVVEFGFAATVLALLFVQLATQGWNLPGYRPGMGGGLSRVVLYPQADQILLFVFHCLLMAIVLTWALMRWDGQRAPWRFYLVSSALLAVPLAGCPELSPAYFFSAELSGLNLWARMRLSGIEMLLGGIAAVGVGLCWALLESRGFGLDRATSLQPMGLAILLGVALGWEACLSCGAFALMGSLSLRLIWPHRSRPWSWPKMSAAAWFFAVLLHHLLWRPLRFPLT